MLVKVYVFIPRDLLERARVIAKKRNISFSKLVTLSLEEELGMKTRRQ